jgi:hypothetical protein
LTGKDEREFKSLFSPQLFLSDKAGYRAQGFAAEGLF